MKTPNVVCLFFVLVCALALPASAIAASGSRVAFPAGVKHDAWDALVKKYVNEQGLVAYEQWKKNAADTKALDDYLAQFAKSGTPAAGNDLAASAINAYNAF